MATRKEAASSEIPCCTACAEWTLVKYDIENFISRHLKINTCQIKIWDQSAK